LNGLGVEFAVTRSVRDCAALLDAVQGPGIGDPYVAPAPASSYVDAARRPHSGLRIAVLHRPWNGVPIDGEVASALVATARDCEALGHTVVEARPELDWDEFLVHTMRYWTANLAAGITQVASALGRPIDPTTLEATTLACYRHGTSVTATELLQAMDVANRITRRFAAFFQQYDVLLTPTLPRPQTPLGTLNANDPALDAEGWTRAVFAFTPFTPVFNLTGQPAISLPLGRTARGLPIGMQFVGRYGAEDTLIGLAAQFEATRPWPQVAPLALDVAGR
jgi:amidase